MLFVLILEIVDAILCFFKNPFIFIEIFSQNLFKTVNISKQTIFGCIVEDNLILISLILFFINKLDNSISRTHDNCFLLLQITIEFLKSAHLCFSPFKFFFSFKDYSLICKFVTQIVEKWFIILIKSVNLILNFPYLSLL